MRVVLLKNVDKLGKAFEEKEVADGYAQNFLLPRGLAKAAMPAVLAQIEKEKFRLKKQQTNQQEGVNELARRLAEYRLILKEKANEQGKLYGGVSASKIAEALKEQGFNVSPEFILLEEPIKEIGERLAAIKFSNKIKIKLKISIQPIL